MILYNEIFLFHFFSILFLKNASFKIFVIDLDLKKISIYYIFKGV
jgi:hypothetical protein